MALFETSDDTLKLEAFIDSKKNGEAISYFEIINDCGIDIRDSKQRKKFYTACQHLKRECQCKRGFGYVLSSKDNALAIVNEKTNRIISSAERTVRVIEHIEDRHSTELTSSQLSVLQNTKYVGSAISGQAQSAKKIIRKEQPKLEPVKPVLNT